MARQNTVIMFGIVAESPRIMENSNGSYAFVHIIVARGTRPVGDGRILLKCDNPVIMTRNEDLIKEIETWKKHDIVHVKGTISSKTIKKKSICTHCGQKNSFIGALVYINPIFAEKLGHAANEEESLKYLSDHREVSNQVFAIGVLCRDPGKVRSKYDYKITQYQIAIARKYRVRSDPPEIRIDFPWVKSYGENAEEDFKRLRIGSVVFIDGFLQARNIERRNYCGQDTDEKGHPKKDDMGMPVFRTDEKGKAVGCGMQYEWKDSVLELVPYETEYLSGFLTDDDLLRAGENNEEPEDGGEE